MKTRGLAVAICLALIPCLHAESFTTNIIDGFYTNAGPQFTLGATGPYNFLLVTNGGRLTNDGIATNIVGDAAAAHSNTAVVTGTNSVWSSSYVFFLGNTGALNRVSVLNDALFRSGVIYVGFRSSSNQLNVHDAFAGSGVMVLGKSSNANFNIVSFDGPNARGGSESTFVGRGGASNSLVIRNGAQYTVGSPLGIPEFVIGETNFSDGNSVEVLGAGSKLISSPRLQLGVEGSGNRLLVDGAHLDSSFAQIGVGCGSSNNAVLVRGQGALWTNAFLHLGVCGMSNSLTITDGAQVLSGRLTSSFQSGRRNRIEVAGTGSVLRAATLLLGDRGSADSLVITDGGQIISDGARLAGDGSDNFVLVTGAGSSLDCIGLSVGGFGPRNILRVENGASVQSGQVFFGSDYYAVQNSIHLVGPGTRLNATNVSIGRSGRSNDVTVAAGAILSSYDIQVGGAPGGGPGVGDLNMFSVIGSNSLVFARDLIVGFQARSNRLEIIDGGQIHSAGRGVIGENSGLRNSAIVSGHRSQWIMTNELIVGQRALVSSLVVSNGGFVRSHSGLLGTIGEGVGGGSGCQFADSAARVRVTGHNSLWAIADSLVVGSNAISNSLLIDNGARVAAQKVVIGLKDGGRTTFGTVQPTNNLFLNELEIAGGDLRVGNFGPDLLEVRYGTLRLRSGIVNAGELRMTNRWSRLELFGGALTCPEAIVNNRLPLVIGDGLHNARFQGRNITAPGGVVIREHATLISDGRIIANVTNSGNLSPFAYGNTVIASNFVQQPAGNLFVDVALGQANLLAVANVATLDGKLSVTRGPNAPSNSVIITAAAVNGTFSNATNGARIKTTGNLGSFIVEYTATSVLLRDFQWTDLDGDMVEDAWATRHFGHSPLTPAEKAADEDGDGSSNYDEFIAGTDPKNSASALRASISYANGGATVTFPCQEGKRYHISWSSDLITWNSVVDPTFSFPEAGVCRWIDDGRTGGLGGPARFFRVSVE